jgi:hypothetical protein
MIETKRFKGICKIHKNHIRGTSIEGIEKGSPLEGLVRSTVNATINERFLLNLPSEEGIIFFKGKVRDSSTKRTIEVSIQNFVN